MALQTTIFGTIGSPDAAHITSIRRLGSIDILDPISATELPDDVIEDQIYLDSAESEVLRDTGLSVSDVNAATGERQKALQTLLIIKTVQLLLPQFIQITDQRVLDRATKYQSSDWTEKEEQLQNRYQTTLIIINPTPTTVKGSIGINIAQTASRLND